MQCKVCGQDNPPEAGFCGNCGATLVTTVGPPSPAAAAAAAYMGFWIRFGAAIIDGVIVFAILFVILLPVYYWLFTGLKGQTPGKMAVRIKVVDAQGNRPTLRVAARREILGRTISTIALCLGFLWIAWDKQKRGWHDMIASTYVVKVVKAKSKE